MPTRAEKERRLWAEAAARPPTATERDALYKSSRLGLPLFLRVPLAFASSFAVGFTLGTIQGGRMTGLRFRAEHAHKLPASPAGWFLYHKSKNYHVTLGGLKEGLKMGAKISLLGTAMFGIEAMFDEYRGAKDVFNTVIAAVTVSGCLSFWNGFSLAEAARTSRWALIGGVVYGGVQDLAFASRGQPIGYVEFLRRQMGKPAVQPAASASAGEKPI